MTCVLPAQTLDDVDARLTSVSDQMNLCTAVLSDLKELGDVLVVGRVLFFFFLSLALLTNVFDLMRCGFKVHRVFFRQKRSIQHVTLPMQK